MTRKVILVMLAACGLAGCDFAVRREDEPRGDDAATDYATAYATGSERLTPEELEAGRLEMDWREWIERDTTALDSLSTPQDSVDAASGPARETWDDITMESVNNGPALLPVHGDVAGPSVLRVQILLDRARFSPGIMDGRWGRNTEKAVFWLQRREGLRATGAVDEPTWERLQQLAGRSGELIVQRQLTQDDVAGPFVSLPDDYYERRDLDCQCYESLGEKLAERFHTSEETLRKLNDGADLNALTAGATLNVLAVEPRAVDAGETVARLVISDGGRYLHALDAASRILYHFPATLGSDYSPSPSGDYRVTNIAHDPPWHYQPKLLEGVPDSDPAAVLPAGPNNAVGVVWIQLSKPHYGIHGTSRPETIGYATSNGCVRLTNWDADFLSRQIAPGTAVEFRDVRGSAALTPPVR
jgi:lipoprotein-anchoring transpeptidase ErfK/SrfK